MSAQNKPNGFTLVELLVVISIIAILAMIGGVIFIGVLKGARDAKRRADIDAVANALEVNKDNATGLYKPLQGAFFTSGQIPYDPLEPSVNQWPPGASSCGGGSNYCFYCYKSSAQILGYCVGADWLLNVNFTDPGTSYLVTKWIVCANLETGTPAYYCRSNQQ